MKRARSTFLIVSFLLLTVGQAWSLDISIGSATLPNSDPRTEESWLESLTWVMTHERDVQFIIKYEDKYSYPLYPEKKSLNFDPENSEWIYAVVKYGRVSTAFRDDGDGILTLGPLDQGISHVSFFGTGVKLPEPATMILLGLGLLGLGIVTRRRS